MTALLEAIHLCKSFEQEGEIVPVLNRLSFQVAAGETLAIMGPSGSGKSTLLSLMGGLDVPTGGTVKWNGDDIHGLSATKRAAWRNRHLGFVFQFHHLLGEFSALENTALPLLIAGTQRKIAFQKAEALLSELNLSHRLGHRPAALSGGERQRVAIARALIGDPELLLADEPTGSLDHEQGEQILNYLLKSGHERNMAIVMVTHNAAISQRMNRILSLNDGMLN